MTTRRIYSERVYQCIVCYKFLPDDDYDEVEIGGTSEGNVRGFILLCSDECRSRIVEVKVISVRE